MKNNHKEFRPNFLQEFDVVEELTPEELEAIKGGLSLEESPCTLEYCPAGIPKLDPDPQPQPDPQPWPWPWPKY